jgi:hypothetical protein
MNKLLLLGTIFVAGAALAQRTPVAVEEGVPPAVEQEGRTPAGGPLAVPAEPSVDPDNMADQLNARQQLKQDFTLRRIIDGKVVETEKRTVVYSRGDAMLPTEAGLTPVERLRAAFERETLTRTDAFEEAKLDFTVADLDRDAMMTADEFAHLALTRRDNEVRAVEPTDVELARQRQYEAFFAEIDPQSAREEAAATARRKFAFMAGARESLSRQDYIREYLLDFDSMDRDNDGVLQSEDLLRFRAMNRGEAVDLPQVESEQ